MIQKFRLKILALGYSLMVALPLGVPALVSAGTVSIQNQACNGAQTLQFGQTAQCNSNVTEGSLNKIIAKVINILSVLVGIIAVIMIVVGGFRYVTSGGDSTKVGNAKSTILYALIGLVIVAVAQIIVKFVLTTSTTQIDGT